MNKKDEKVCFVIMPISDVDGYEPKHFELVYQDIIKIACKNAGYTAIRADDVKQTNLIHKDILHKILESPMAICDLSSNNPNVLFELGIRQAFDKPTVLIKDTSTDFIFDLSPLRYTEYTRVQNYRDVLKSQELVGDAIKKTEQSSEDSNNINSLINLLSLPKAATLKDEINNETDKFNILLLQQINEILDEIKSISSYNVDNIIQGDINRNEIWTLITQLKNLINNGCPKPIIKKNYYDIEKRIKEFDDNLSNYEKKSLNKELENIKNYFTL